MVACREMGNKKHALKITDLGLCFGQRADNFFYAYSSHPGGKFFAGSSKFSEFFQVFQ